MAPMMVWRETLYGSHKCVFIMIDGGTSDGGEGGGGDGDGSEDGGGEGGGGD